MGMGNFFSEIKRRNVLRVGAAYAVASFAMIEVVSNVAPALSLPDWTLKLVIVLLALGFPGVVTFAWIYELTPEGLKRTEDVENKVSIAHQTGHRLNIVIIGLMVVLAGVYGAERFLLTDKAADGAVRTSADAPAKQSTPEGISIAVLPFVNLSSDPEQEFFSDGMTEEITSALAKIQSLRVVGRTSAFEFKGQNKDLHAIGLALRASHLLEGSVRKEGNQIRVTAQLIRADDGTHIWTDNYDRELKGVFAIQDEVAQAIAGALQMPLGLKRGETLVVSRTADPEIHQQYLRAKAIWRARVDGEAEAHQAVDIGEQVVARDPAYAPAWALLAQVYAAEPGTGRDRGSLEEYRRRVDTYLTKAEVAGRRAIELDPKNADSYVGLAFASQSRGNYGEAENVYKQALEIDAFNPDLLHFHSLSLIYNGRIKEALAVRQQLQMLEPLVPRFNGWTGIALEASGQYEAALAIYKALPIDDANRPGNLIKGNILLGRGGDAANVILSYQTLYSPAEVAAAVRLLRMPLTVVAPKNLPELTAPQLGAVYLYVGARERNFTLRSSRFERQSDAGYHFPNPVFWAPFDASARKTERFKALMRKAGLVEYWRARGWPDVCRPVGADDFECD